MRISDDGLFHHCDVCPSSHAPGYIGFVISTGILLYMLCVIESEINFRTGNKKPSNKANIHTCEGNNVNFTGNSIDSSE